VTLRQFYERYGATLAVVAVLALLVVLLPGNAKNEGVQVGAGAGAPSANQSDTGGGDASTADSGGTVAAGGGAAGAGSSQGGTRIASAGSGPTQVSIGKGPNCRTDGQYAGRQKGISAYMPPCVSFSGSNGGATSRGVFGDKIVVVAYSIAVDPGTRAILVGAKLSDEIATVRRAYEALRLYYNNHFETYGREVQIINMDASGKATDDEAMKADVLKIANDTKAFAVIEGNPAEPIPKVFAQEAAARGVVCICTVSMRSGFYQENHFGGPSGPNMLWSSLPTITEYSAMMAEYICKRLAGKPAKWAGTNVPDLKTQTRKFGLIYLEGREGKVDPEGKKAADELSGYLSKCGVSFAAQVGYLYDPGRNQADVTNLVAKMKGNGVTTIIPYVDPLYPILITREATNQQYFPEWLIAGTGLSDTTSAARLYDQQQWSHAFGISPLWVTWATKAKSSGYREAHHGDPTLKPDEEGVLINIYKSYFQALFIGIHMAGPKLSPQTFEQGMYNYPRTGGSAALPTVYSNRAYPTLIKDFIEIYYDPNVSGPDERTEQGNGMIMKVDGGKRYAPGQWPTGEPHVFNSAGAATVTDNPAGGGDPPHEQDGHAHNKKCLSCS
jgi:hypothetical protein